MIPLILPVIAGRPASGSCQMWKCRRGEKCIMFVGWAGAIIIVFWGSMTKGLENLIHVGYLIRNLVLELDCRCDLRNISYLSIFSSFSPTLLLCTQDLNEYREYNGYDTINNLHCFEWSRSPVSSSPPIFSTYTQKDQTYKFCYKLNHTACKVEFIHNAFSVSDLHQVHIGHFSDTHRGAERRANDVGVEAHTYQLAIFALRRSAKQIHDHALLW